MEIKGIGGEARISWVGISALAGGGVGVESTRAEKTEGSARSFEFSAALTLKPQPQTMF